MKNKREYDMENIHECLLCRRDMKKSMKLLGNGCMKKAYNLLDLSMPKFQKEDFLYESIMKKNGIRSLNEKQKIWLTDRYLTNQYLLKIPYGNFLEIQKEINQDIAKVKKVSKIEELKSSAKLSLKQAYEMYKRAEKFKVALETLKKMNIRDEETQKFIKASFSYIFHIYKNRTQYENDSIKAMQYVFWQTVIESGREAFGYELAADLLQHSLEEKPEEFVISDEQIIAKVKENEDFKNKIDKIIEQHRNEISFYIAEGEESLDFNDSDLYFAIHSAKIEMNAIKSDKEKWNIDISLSDRFDFTEWKWPNKYYNDTNGIFKSMLSSTLYNLAYVSQKLEVVKEYRVVIKFSFEK